MRESAVERHLVQRVKALGGMCVKLAPTMTGLPDRLVMLPGGGIWFVELKQPKGKVAPIQVEMHRRLDVLGHPVATLWNRDQIDLWLEFR